MIVELGKNETMFFYYTKRIKELEELKIRLIQAKIKKHIQKIDDKIFYINSIITREIISLN